MWRQVDLSLGSTRGQQWVSNSQLLKTSVSRCAGSTTEPSPMTKHRNRHRHQHRPTHDSKWSIGEQVVTDIDISIDTVAYLRQLKPPSVVYSTPHTKLNMFPQQIYIVNFAAKSYLAPSALPYFCIICLTIPMTIPRDTASNLINRSGSRIHPLLEFRS